MVVRVKRLELPHKTKLAVSLVRGHFVFRDSQYFYISSCTEDWATGSQLFLFLFLFLIFLFAFPPALGCSAIQETFLVVRAWWGGVVATGIR